MYRYLALRSRIQSRILAVQIEAPQAGELYLCNIDLKHSSLDRALYVTQEVVCICGTQKARSRLLPLACKQITIKEDLDKKVDTQ